MIDHAVKIENIIRIAKEAGEVALQLYNKDYSVEEKKNKTPVTTADRAIHDFLMEKLSIYNHPILSEEGCDDLEKRVDAEYVWIIDPLDGTSDFIQKTGDFSILIGLVKGCKPVLGVVCEPAKNTVYWAEKGKSAFMEKHGDVQKIHVSDKNNFSDMTILLSRNHLLASDTALCEKLGISKKIKRGSTSKMCVIARGDAEIYVNTSDKTAEWDTCAPHIILQEAGGKLTDTKNNPIAYNKESPMHSNGFIASNKIEHVKVVEVLSEVL